MILVLKKNNVLLTTTLVFIILFSVLKQLSISYESYAEKSYNLSIEKQLISKGSTLKEVIDSRFALLKGLNSYVTTALNINTNFFDEHNQLTEAFVKSLYENASGIRNISIAKNAVQSFVYPINKKVLGHNLLTDKRLNVVKNTRKAIETRQPIIDGPYELRQGGLGIVLRIAIYNKDEFWGIVAMVVDASKLFVVADILPTNQQFSIVARNINKNIVLGSIPEGKIEPILYRVKLYDKYIDLLAYPKNSQYMNNLSFFINIIILIISLLFSYIVYILLSRGVYLKKQIQKALFALERKDEILEQTVEIRTEELKKTIFNLQKTQKQLVESEKIASLGSLVAGVAHEINTPIGIGITGITHFLVINKELAKNYESDSLSKEKFEKFIETSYELATVINMNLSRAAELIKSFKKIAVDRASEEKRKFNVKDYLNEILISLKSIIKKTKHEYTIECPDNLIINSYPGLFSQVITNFIINSIIHAFNDNKIGRIQIAVKKEKNNLCIMYKDNGSGISEENLPKIFDPFFTTNRKAGGSGLGLNIVHNLIVSQLKGTISVKSQFGKGVEFNLEIPI